MGKEEELMEAARNGEITIVNKILEQISKRSIGPLSSFRRSTNINAQDMNGYTALHHACLNGHSNIVRLLLIHGVIPDIPDIRGSTPLYLAAWAGYSDIMKMLLFHSEKPSNPNAQTIDNETPLHCAAQHGHNIALSVLLSYGADPNIRNNSFQTPLDLASQFGRLQVVQMLIRAHPELIEPFRHMDEKAVNDTGCVSSNENITSNRHIFTHTCLHLASRNGHKKVVEALLMAGVDVNIMTHFGSALHEAALCGKKSVVVTLLEAGINTNAIDGNGRTVLEMLQEYPPHVTYEIVSIISEFCKNDGCFKSLKDKNENEIMFVKNSYTFDDPSSNMKNFRDLSLVNNANIVNVKDKSKQPGYYLKMKPINAQQHIKELNNNVKHSNFTFNTDIIFLKNNNINGSKHLMSPLHYNGVDDYVKMTKPDNDTIIHSKRKNIKAPIPSPRKLNNDDYENIVNVRSTEIVFDNAEETTLYPMNINCNFKKEKSITPEEPPPSVTQAENTIIEFMQPLNIKNKRKSIRLNIDTNLDLDSVTIENSGNEYSNEMRNSQVSDCIEEFFGDAPFAGLFKGSTYTLNVVNENEDPNAINLLQQQPKILRSPTLVKAIKPIPAKRKISVPRVNSNEKLNLSNVWEEIDIILESIDNEVSDIDLNKSNASDFPLSNVRNEQVYLNKSIQIRKPSDLVVDMCNNGDVVRKWCHSTNALIFGEIVYKVYYLGSTIIRQLCGTLSTRKSIQKLKREETVICAENFQSEHLFEDCNNVTKILKANSQQIKLEVDIAFSYMGVKFIDHDKKTIICSHDIQNINCVCQDNEDLRYFAYITKEADTHFCHVFMVDDLDLATKIILTLGQAFEISYQLTIKHKEV